MTKEEIRDYFAKGIDCGQVTLTALCGELGLAPETAQKLTAALGGGMFNGECCGAYMAGVLAIGLCFGHTDSMDAEKLNERKGKLMAVLSEYRNAFIEAFGSTSCRNCLGYKIPEEMGAAIESGRMMSYCPELTEKNLGILSELLKEA